MLGGPFVIRFYQTPSGRVPIQEWLESLDDWYTLEVLHKRIDRLEDGYLGQWRSLGDGVFETKIDFGPGFRIYFGFDSRQVVILLMGGDKKSQKRDIDAAKNYWKDYIRRSRGA